MKEIRYGIKTHGGKKSLGEKFHKEFVEGETLREEGTILVKKLINSNRFINIVLYC